MKLWVAISLSLLLVSFALAGSSSSSSSEECDSGSGSNESRCGNDSNGGGESGEGGNGGGGGGGGGSGGTNRCNSQPEGTILPAHDCSMFVSCSSGKEQEHSCVPPGTMFDHERVVCDYPDNAKCWEGDLCSGQDDGFVVPSEVCSKFFVCKNGRLDAEHSCVPSGTVYDHQRRVCDYPENAVCWGTDGTSTPPGGGGSNPGGTTAAPPTRPPVTDDELRNLCKGIVIGILSHPSSCTRYVVCVMGQPTVEACDEDHIFYPEVNVCGYGNTATCEGDALWLAEYMRTMGM